MKIPSFYIFLLIWVLAPASSRSQEVFSRKFFTVTIDTTSGLASCASWRMTRKRAEASGTFDRPSSFHVGDGWSTNLYTNTGFHRGHLVPARHMSFDSVAVYESMEMINIVPQYPFTNQGYVEDIEEMLLELAKVVECVDIYVHVSPAVRIKGISIPIPTSIVYEVETCDNKPLMRIPVFNLKGSYKKHQ